MLRLKLVICEYLRFIFNPKSLIVFSAVFFGLCAMPLSDASAAKVTLGWDSNPEPDLEGYVVYRNVGEPGPPYDHSDMLSEDDLPDPLHPRATLTGLNEGKEYYIALTAYNTEGVESSFSNDVCVEVVDNTAQLCSESSSPAGSTSSSIDSGGSGNNSCFISTAGAETSTFSQWVEPIIRSQVLTMLFLLLVLLAAVKLGFNKVKSN